IGQRDTLGQQILTHGQGCIEVIPQQVDVGMLGCGTGGHESPDPGTLLGAPGAMLPEDFLDPVSRTKTDSCVQSQSSSGFSTFRTRARANDGRVLAEQDQRRFCAARASLESPKRDAAEVR